MSETSSSQFRTVLRGYEPAEVDRRLRELTESLHAAHRQSEQLHRKVQALENAPAPKQAAPAEPTQPTFSDFGARIGNILALAEEEASDLRAKAQTDADDHRRLAEESVAQVRADAQRYATDQRSTTDAEIARVLEDAKRKADDMLDEADRDATARREEASAVYEQQRAKAAQAAADFETTLAQRRERAEQDFNARSGASEKELAAITDRAEQMRTEAERLHSDAQRQAKRIVEEAQHQASELVSASKTRADRIRAESERELSAASQRRDSINAQLTNVRQMLATLSGTAPVNPMGDDEQPAKEQPAQDPKAQDPKGQPVPQKGAERQGEPAAKGQADKPAQQGATKPAAEQASASKK